MRGAERQVLHATCVNGTRRPSGGRKVRVRGQGVSERPDGHGQEPASTEPARPTGRTEEDVCAGGEHRPRLSALEPAGRAELRPLPWGSSPGVPAATYRWRLAAARRKRRVQYMMAPTGSVCLFHTHLYNSTTDSSPSSSTASKAHGVPTAPDLPGMHRMNC